MSLEKDLHALASAIVKKAQEKDTVLQDSTDALKALTTLYAVLKKNSGKSGDTGDDGTPSFDNFSEALKEHANGEPPVETRDRRRKTGTIVRN